jgi:hypothetical protein
MVSLKSKNFGNSALIKRIKAKYVAFSSKKRKNLEDLPPAKSTDCLEFPEDIVLVVKKRQYTKDTEISNVKKEGDKRKYARKHTFDDDDSTKDLSFLEGAQEGLKMAVQDVFGPTVMCAGDNTSSRRSYSMQSYNSVPKEVDAPCIYDKSNNSSHEIVENDVSFLEGVQKGLKMVYSDVSSDLVSFFQKK